MCEEGIGDCSDASHEKGNLEGDTDRPIDC